MISRGGWYLLTLINEILDLSRIEAGRWIPEPVAVSLESAANECWAMFADRAATRRVTFTRAFAPDAATVTADPHAVRHVLQNLVDNALRYVPEGGAITCRSERADGGVVLSVEDNGSGINSTATNNSDRVAAAMPKARPRPSAEPHDGSSS